MRYVVNVSNGTGGETNGTNFTLSLEKGATYSASVRCLDPAGKTGSRSDIIKVRAGKYTS